MIKEDRGGFKREIVVGDKMNNFLSESPVFDSIWAEYIFMFRGLNLVCA